MLYWVDELTTCPRCTRRCRRAVPMTGPACDEIEVVWPLHRSHYLSPMLTDEDLAMRRPTPCPLTTPRPRPPTR